MFIDEIKIYARAGHGGKGCVAFQREKYRPKGGPSGGNGGRGGDVILEADHDLNNLIAQYFQPRLIAQDGKGGLGKGMDGPAGKDLIVKVPCGTLVWRVETSAHQQEAEETGDESKVGLVASSSQRPRFKTALAGAAMEYDLSEEAPERSAADYPKSEGDLVVDLTEHGQRFVLCKAGRGGLGNRNFATAARQAPRFAQPREAG